MLMMVSLVGTMGVCLSPCSLPGAGPMFQMGPYDMELGMGMFCTLITRVNSLLSSLERCT